MNILNILRLLFVKFPEHSFTEDLGKTDNRVKGCAQLV